MERQVFYGNKIRELRRGRAWTQEHLAEAAGLDARTIQRVERDSTRDSATLLSIAAAFDLPLGQLRKVLLRPESRLVATHFMGRPPILSAPRKAGRVKRIRALSSQLERTK